MLFSADPGVSLNLTRQALLDYCQYKACRYTVWSPVTSQFQHIPFSVSISSTEMATVDEKTSAFRQHLPDLSLPRFTTMQKQDSHEYAEDFKSSGRPPWLHGLYLHWRELFQEPFRGITNDGNRTRSATHFSCACCVRIADTVKGSLEAVYLIYKMRASLSML